MPGTADVARPALPPTLAPRVPTWVANVCILGLMIIAFFVSRKFSALLTQRGYRWLNYDYDILIHISIAIILAVSLNLINGITGQFSLGHAGFMSMGAYTAGVLFAHHKPEGFWLFPAILGAVLLSGTVAAGAGLAVGVPSLRLRGDYLAIVTLGFGQIIAVVLNKIEWIGPYRVGGAAGLHDIPLVSNLFWTFSGALICVVVVWRMVHSAKGKAFVAVREDEVAAASVGINPTRVKVTAFVIGSFFAGIAGGLHALFEGNLSPGSFEFMRSMEIVVMVVLGGSGSITGSILAAALLTYLPEELRTMSKWGRDLSEWRLVIYALLLIITMLLRPEGLMGSRELWWTRKRLPRALGSAAGGK